MSACIIDVIGRVVSHLRFAAGVFVLATGLLMGSAGGAVAVAQPDSSGSTANGAGTKQDKKAGADTKQDKKAGADTKQDKKAGADTKQDKKAGADTKQDKKAGADTKQDKKAGAGTKQDKKAGADTKQDKKAGAGTKQDKKAGTDTKHDKKAGAGTKQDKKDSGVVAPVPDQVAPVPNVVAPVPDLIASIPNLIAPVSDVIAPVQDMLTSVAGAVVPATQLQSDLSSFSLGIAGAEPVENGLEGIDGSRLSATAGASIFGAMSEAGRASSLPGMAPPAPNGAIPMGVRSFPPHALDDLPVAVSLAALAAVALPAVGGLVIFNLAVVRVGYRQAKADFALQTAGIARFARRGAGQGAASRRRSSP